MVHLKSDLIVMLSLTTLEPFLFLYLNALSRVKVNQKAVKLPNTHFDCTLN